jgi:hypothetical protein
MPKAEPPSGRRHEIELLHEIFVGVREHDDRVDEVLTGSVTHLE